MTTWTPEEVALLTGSKSLVLTVGDDGYPGVEIGMVLVCGELYVRAYRGVRSRWYQAAQGERHGQIRLGAVIRDVTLETQGFWPVSEIDSAYRSKYGQVIGSLVASPTAQAGTVRINPVPSRMTTEALIVNRSA